MSANIWHRKAPCRSTGLTSVSLSAQRTLQRGAFRAPRLRQRPIPFAHRPQRSEAAPRWSPKWWERCLVTGYVWNSDHGICPRLFGRWGRTRPSGVFYRRCRGRTVSVNRLLVTGWIAVRDRPHGGCAAGDRLHPPVWGTGPTKQDPGIAYGARRATAGSLGRRQTGAKPPAKPTRCNLGAGESRKRQPRTLPGTGGSFYPKAGPRSRWRIASSPQSVNAGNNQGSGLRPRPVRAWCAASCCCTNARPPSTIPALR